MKMKEEEEIRAQRLKEQARFQVQQQFQQFKVQPSQLTQDELKAQQKKAEQRGDTPPKKEDKPKSQQDAQLAQFIKRNVPKIKVLLNITDMKEWRKRNKLDDKTKVFIVKGGYGDIKRALKARGWVENKDKSSPCFDLKYTLKTSDIDFDNLQPGQIVNHYSKTTSITRKVGLTHSLKNLIWFNNVDVDTFYPRCFDLGL